MIVRDTNVISEAMKPEANPAVRAWFNGQVAETLYLTSAAADPGAVEPPTPPVVFPSG